MGKAFYQGRYRPKYPAKYKGDSENIIYRSSWELNCMRYFDLNPGILWWASEEVVIPYRSPIDGRRRRYFPDFVVKTVNNETIVIEIKPYNQTVEPVPQKTKTKKYLNEVYTWGINSAKWKAAEEYCKDRGWKFQVLTEKDLYPKKPK